MFRIPRSPSPDYSASDRDEPRRTRNVEPPPELRSRPRRDERNTRRDRANAGRDRGQFEQQFQERPRRPTRESRESRQYAGPSEPTPRPVPKSPISPLIKGFGPVGGISVGKMANQQWGFTNSNASTGVGGQVTLGSQGLTIAAEGYSPSGAPRTGTFSASRKTGIGGEITDFSSHSARPKKTRRASLVGTGSGPALETSETRYHRNRAETTDYLIRYDRGQEILSGGVRRSRTLDDGAPPRPRTESYGASASYGLPGIGAAANYGYTTPNFELSATAQGAYKEGTTRYDTQLTSGIAGGNYANAGLGGVVQVEPDNYYVDTVAMGGLGIQQGPVGEQYHASGRAQITAAPRRIEEASAQGAVSHRTTTDLRPLRVPVTMYSEVTRTRELYYSRPPQGSGFSEVLPEPSYQQGVDYAPLRPRPIEAAPETREVRPEPTRRRRQHRERDSARREDYRDYRNNDNDDRYR